MAQMRRAKCYSPPCLPSAFFIDRRGCSGGTPVYCRIHFTIAYFNAASYCHADNSDLGHPVIRPFQAIIESTKSRVLFTGLQSDPSPIIVLTNQC